MHRLAKPIIVACVSMLFAVAAHASCRQIRRTPAQGAIDAWTGMYCTDGTISGRADSGAWSDSGTYYIAGGQMHISWKKLGDRSFPYSPSPVRQ
jgi:hypothetical protein